ncbi:MAG: biopolymer transporter ExbD [Bacteroidaceae bacterium]|nr:biopolymer transporter ExbD [Bacteroidaceae bacterium]
MGRFKITKQDMFIDMTPMSDVMVLLLTFFMLSATFVKEEPVKVVTPGSVQTAKIPESNLLTIFVNNNGKVYMTLDNPENMKKLAEKMVESDALELSPKQVAEFSQTPTFGAPMNMMAAWLNMDGAARNRYLNTSAEAGIPCDTTADGSNNELELWVKAARAACGEGLRVAIKADQATSYAVIEKVMNSLRRVDENRYNLITALKGGEE